VYFQNQVVHLHLDMIYARSCEHDLYNTCLNNKTKKCDDKILTYFEEEEQKSSLYGLNMLGYTCATRVNTMSYLNVNFSKSYKNYLSSNCRLKLVYMKSESLVIVNNHVTVNDLSNFAHTAHHARRVVTAVNVIED